MDTWEWLAVSNSQALRFFFERLKDVSEDATPDTNELLYNASVLAHFASTSTASAAQFPSGPADLTTFFNLFVLDRSRHADPELMEAAAAQCLLLTGFFQDQLRRRHNVEWYAALGAGLYDQAAHHEADRLRSKMMLAMARHFEFWRRQQQRLAQELRDTPRLVVARPADPDPTIVR